MRPRAAPWSHGPKQRAGVPDLPYAIIDGTAKRSRPKRAARTKKTKRRVAPDTESRRAGEALEAREAARLERERQRALRRLKLGRVGKKKMKKQKTVVDPLLTVSSAPKSRVSSLPPIASRSPTHARSLRQAEASARHAQKRERESMRKLLVQCSDLSGGNALGADAAALLRQREDEHIADLHRVNLAQRQREAHEFKLQTKMQSSIVQNCFKRLANNSLYGAFTVWRGMVRHLGETSIVRRDELANSDVLGPRSSVSRAFGYHSLETLIAHGIPDFGCLTRSEAFRLLCLVRVVAVSPSVRDVAALRLFSFVARSRNRWGCKVTFDVVAELLELIGVTDPRTVGRCFAALDHSRQNCVIFEEAVDAVAIVARLTVLQCLCLACIVAHLRTHPDRTAKLRKVVHSIVSRARKQRDMFHKLTELAAAASAAATAARRQVPASRDIKEIELVSAMRRGSSRSSLNGDAQTSEPASTGMVTDEQGTPFRMMSTSRFEAHPEKGSVGVDSDEYFAKVENSISGDEALPDSEAHAAHAKAALAARRMSSFGLNSQQPLLFLGDDIDGQYEVVDGNLAVNLTHPLVSKFYQTPACIEELLSDVVVSRSDLEAAMKAYQAPPQLKHELASGLDRGEDWLAAPLPKSVPSTHDSITVAVADETSAAEDSYSDADYSTCSDADDGREELADGGATGASSRQGKPAKKGPATPGVDPSNLISPGLFFAAILRNDIAKRSEVAIEDPRVLVPQRERECAEAQASKQQRLARAVSVAEHIRTEAERLGAANNEANQLSNDEGSDQPEGQRDVSLANTAGAAAKASSGGDSSSLDAHGEDADDTENDDEYGDDYDDDDFADDEYENDFDEDAQEDATRKEEVVRELKAHEEQPEWGKAEQAGKDAAAAQAAVLELASKEKVIADVEANRVRAAAEEVAALDKLLLSDGVLDQRLQHRAMDNIDPDLLHHPAFRVVREP
eukprot:INCI7752.2.p1 GENE.INCI7752.2~~INCI7752.2.p1  ORF type:complete len:965 (+),score=202.20 INCI7752.2:305-3199(+)